MLIKIGIDFVGLEMRCSYLYATTKLFARQKKQFFKDFDEIDIYCII